MTPLAKGHKTYGGYGRPVMRCSRGTTMTTAAAPRMSVPWPEEFPTELLFEILKYLPQGDLARACRVDRYWYSVASSTSLWADLDLSNLPTECMTRLPDVLVTRLGLVASLTMEGPVDIPRQVLRETIFIVSNSPRLTALSLYSAIEVSEDMLITLFSQSRGSLKHVDLSFCHHIGSDSIISLVSHHPNLLTLNLSHTSLTDDGLLILHRLRDLTDLSLEGCYNLTRTSMSQFLQSNLPPRLSRLNLSYLFTVLGEWLTTLNSAVKLERLDVRHVENITKRDVRGFLDRWGTGCEVLSTARLETDDEYGWKQYVDDIVKAEAVY